jgi:hypothetical protein
MKPPVGWHVVSVGTENVEGPMDHSRPFLVASQHRVLEDTQMPIDSCCCCSHCSFRKFQSIKQRLHHNLCRSHKLTLSFLRETKPKCSQVLRDSFHHRPLSQQDSGIEATSTLVTFPAGGSAITAVETEAGTEADAPLEVDARY